MVGLFARMLPGGIVKETYQTLMGMPGVRDNLYDTLSKERWGANIPGVNFTKRVSDTKQNIEMDTPYATLEKLWKYRIFRVGLRELLANIARNDHTYHIAQDYHFENIDDITNLSNPNYRRDNIFPHIFPSSSSEIIPPLSETMKQKIVYIINTAFGDEGYAQILLEKILHKGPYGGRQMHINSSTSLLRDQDGNITAKRIGDELIQRLGLLTSSSSPHSTLSPQAQPE